MVDETRDVLAELREHKWQKKAAKQIESGSRQIESLRAENQLQAERIEVLETALRDYVRAQSKIDDRWEVSDATVQHQLLRDLHFCEALGREALKANATQPTTKPTDSDGSST